MTLMIGVNYAHLSARSTLGRLHEIILTKITPVVNELFSNTILNPAFLYLSAVKCGRPPLVFVFSRKRKLLGCLCSCAAWPRHKHSQTMLGAVTVQRKTMKNRGQFTTKTKKLASPQSLTQKSTPIKYLDVRWHSVPLL